MTSQAQETKEDEEVPEDEAVLETIEDSQTKGASEDGGFEGSTYPGVIFAHFRRCVLVGGPCALAQDDEEVSMHALELDPERAKGRDGRLRGVKLG